MKKLLKNKWSGKHDKCIVCGLTKKKHACKGVCMSCYDKNRNVGERKDSINKISKDRYDRIKNTREFKDRRNEYMVRWRKTISGRYSKNRRLRQAKYSRYIKNLAEGTGRLNFKKDKNGIRYYCEGCNKNCCITTNIQPNTNFFMGNVNIYKEEQIKYCKKYSISPPTR